MFDYAVPLVRIAVDPTSPSGYLQLASSIVSNNTGLKTLPNLYFNSFTTLIGKSGLAGLSGNLLKKADSPITFGRIANQGRSVKPAICRRGRNRFKELTDKLNKVEFTLSRLTARVTKVENKGKGLETEFHNLKKGIEELDKIWWKQLVKNVFSYTPTHTAVNLSVLHITFLTSFVVVIIIVLNKYPPLRGVLETIVFVAACVICLIVYQRLPAGLIRDLIADFIRDIFSRWFANRINLLSEAFY